MATAVGVSARAGDIHNFRRHVVIALSDASRLVIKPRSAFWEWLFFGQNSPIRSALGDSFLAGKNGVFGLQVISCKPHLSQVVYLERQVPSTPKNPNLVQEFLYQYGGLLAYAYVFGIEDLHIENLVQRGNRLQVVDVEVVFGNLCLPNQTHLFPLGNLTWSQTGLGHLKVNSVFSEPINLESLLSGYLHASIQISEKSEKILSGLEPYRGELTSTPIRTLLRETGEYTKRIPQLSPLIPEEIEQLERGDIPYFFRFQGQSSIYRYVTKDYQKVEIKHCALTKRLASKISATVEYLLDCDRIIYEQIPRGVLYLADTLLSHSWTGAIQNHYFSLNVSEDGIQGRIPRFDLEFEAQRTSRQIVGPA